jgi:membrane protease YdiL (CAAX protease family)
MNEPPQQGESVVSLPDQTPDAAAPARTGPWGLWPTLGLSLVVAAAYTLVQVVLVTAIVIYKLHETKDLDVEEFGQSLVRNGLFWSAAVCVGAPVIIGLSLLFARAARGITVRDYLALRWPGWKSIGAWCLVLLLFIVIMDSVAWLTRGRLLPPVMEEVYRTAYFVPLLWFAFVVVAPVAEEIFFRGFFFKGLEHSRLGPVGAIVLTAAVWALMHTQYDLYDAAVILLGGLLLGYARWRSGSLYVPLAMHMTQNLLATLEVVAYLSLTHRPT